MPIEFPCIHCQETIRVPDWGRGARTQCPVCRRVLPVPAGRQVPEIEAKSVPRLSEGELDRLAAAESLRARLRVPVNICQGVLVLMLLAVVTGTAAGLTGRLESASGIEVPIFWIASGAAASILCGLALYGLHQAINLQSRPWAWTGAMLAILLGMACWLLLPWAVWTTVVLADPKGFGAFRSERH